MEKTAEIMEVLHEMDEIKANDTRSGFERIILSITNKLRWFGVALFLVLITLALIAVFTGPLSGIWATLARGVFIIQVLAALAWMVLDMLPVVVIVIFYKHYAFRVRQLELEHDFKLAEKLTAFDVQELRLAQQWVSIQVERLRARMTLFFGGSDKIAVFALAGIGWTVWKTLPADIKTLEQHVLLGGLAFLSGLVIGGMFLNVSLKRLTYQKDILTIAITRIDDDR